LFGLAFLGSASLCEGDMENEKLSWYNFSIL